MAVVHTCISEISMQPALKLWERDDTSSLQGQKTTGTQHANSSSTDVKQHGRSRAFTPI